MVPSQTNRNSFQSKTASIIGAKSYGEKLQLQGIQKNMEQFEMCASME